jgi:putative ABC transport system permease protein
VVSASAVNARPLSDYDTGMGIAAAAGSTARDSAVPWATWRTITRDYFRAMGLPLLKGKTFTEDDKVGRPWRIIVSKRLAELLWPGRDPIGQRAECWKGQDGVKAEVIGVVGDMRERGLDSDPTLAVYLPYYGSGRSPVHFVIHTTGSPQALVPMLRATLASMDPSLPMSPPMAASRRSWCRRPRCPATCLRARC